VDEALAFADTIAVMRDGRIVQAAPHALSHRPADAGIARALGEANLQPAQRADGYAITALGPLPLTTDTERDGVVMFRPHQLRMTSEPGPHTLHAWVTACLFRGHDHRVEFAPDSGRDLPERHLRAQVPAHLLHAADRMAEAETVASSLGLGNAFSEA
jgi:iron(III) transport system ATP-binding protein